MVNELETLKQIDVFNLAPRPDRLLGSRQVFTLKRDENGKEKCYKARFVIERYMQIEGVDYFNTFSPMVSFSLVKFFFAVLVTSKRLVASAFRHKMCIFIFQIK